MAALMTVAQIEAKGGVLIGEWQEGWQLFVLAETNAAGWQKLIVRRGGRKRPGRVRSAHLSWNGARMAATRDSDGIPEALRQWVADMMRGAA